MPIYEEKKKKDGKTQYYIRVYVKDEHGNTKQITRHNKEWLGRDGKFEAQKEENRLKENYSNEDNSKKDITLNELMEEYLEYESLKVDEDTLKGKRNMLRHFCINDESKQTKTYPKKKIILFTLQDYMNWKKQIVSKKCRNECLSVRYLNRIHNEICSMIDYAIMNGYCKINFARQTGPFGTSKERKFARKQTNYEVINYDEYLKIMEITKDNLKYNTYFDLEFKRGARTGEIRAFRVKDYNEDKKQLMVNHTMSKSNVLKEPKTASSKAPIDLSNELNGKIKLLISELSKQDGFNENWYIFGGEKPISSHALDYNKDKYFKLCGINKHLRLHDLRHSCATWLFSINIPVTVISKILRHSSINETLQTYIHLFSEEYEKSLLVIDTYKQDQKQDQKISMRKKIA